MPGRLNKFRKRSGKRINLWHPPERPHIDLNGWTPQLSGHCAVCNELTDEVRLVKAKDPAYRVFLHHKCRDTWTASQHPDMATLPF